MKTKLTILALSLATFCVRADDPLTHTVDNSAVRTVKGLGVFSLLDPIWFDLNGRFDDQQKDGIIVRQRQRSEVIAETRDDSGRRSTTTRPVPDKLFFVKNFDGSALTVGQNVSIKCLPIGKIAYGGSEIDSFDCGVSTMSEATTSTRTVTVTEATHSLPARPIAGTITVPAPPARSQEEVILENLGPEGQKLYRAGSLRLPAWPSSPDEMAKRFAARLK